MAMQSNDKYLVAAGSTNGRYNDVAPFHPDIAYPELPFSDTSPEPNLPYALLRSLLAELDLDPQHVGGGRWNPLKSVAQPGQTVVIKPNFVMHRNRGTRDVFAVITHPSILRGLIDYTYIALKGQGRILIADAPQMNCDWRDLMAVQRLHMIQEYYWNRFRFLIELCDLRDFQLTEPDTPAYAGNRTALDSDPLGSIIVNLGERSYFAGLRNQNFYGADYDRQETIRHHQGSTHEYKISRTILSADAVISVPKMKVHKKVGVTLNCKGLVGINTDKNYLVHYRVGTPSQGGDQLPDSTNFGDRGIIRAQRWCYDHLLAGKSPAGENIYKSLLGAYRAVVKPFRPLDQNTVVQDSGNWHGNDSAWRMTADLTQVLYFADANGKLHDSPQRKVFCVTDGIVGGEGNGPLEPTPVAAGMLTASCDAMSADLVTTRLMGIDPRRLRQFSPAFSPASPLYRDLQRVIVRCEGREWRYSDAAWPFVGRAFEPHPGWTGHIESAEQRRSAAALLEACHS
jgi:uncharacterized protein (DUF362 family)